MTRERNVALTATQRSLEERAVRVIPDDLDLWPQVHQRLVAQRSQREARGGGTGLLRSLRHAVLVLPVCLALGLGGLGVAAAASPLLRHALEQTFGLPGWGSSGEAMDTRGQPLELHPTPRFRVYYPSALPATMAFRAIGQFHLAGDTLGANGGITSNVLCPQVGAPADCDARARRATLSLFPGFDQVPPAQPSLVVPLVQQGIDVVWFGMHALPPEAGRIEIAEWNASRALSRPGTTITIAGHPATLESGQSESTVTFTQNGTSISVRTDLGTAATIRVAESLREFSVNKR